ncbi:MAG: tRNA preQ1(34) S-adenosylmethionine ribosyltransferase-isomerase QueA [Myxococcota bacterium]|nr:tRNA preQ1(34) S-adenosylmethionine ribosyltransferase-isomerase QueA [Myxococcota bacterium]
MSSPFDLDAFAFDLPPERIAQQPLAQRDQARLMLLDRASGQIGGGRRVCDLPDLLAPEDLLVINTTRVLAARLRGQKVTGGRAEALLIGAEGDPAQRRFRALVQSRGRLRVGLGLRFSQPSQDISLAAEVVALHPGGEVSLVFEPGPSPYSIGEAPLPPYIRRPPGDAESPESEGQRAHDFERYQTVFARVPGAVAAPTAGLHLTPELLQRLGGIGVEIAEVVLHVGPGTFRPLRDEDFERGKLHREQYVLPQATVDAVAQARSRGGRIVAVGTTSTRVLESCTDEAGRLVAGEGETELFIRPGQPFRTVDGLLTNFHLPRSSLLLLVAAFAGVDSILKAYRQAVADEYRFYSYGDAMLIL